MAFEAEFKKYECAGRHKEEKFTLEFLSPLLKRLGFSVILPYHGQREFGRDLIFGEIDRFSTFVYHGLQAKYEESIGQADSHDLTRDCDEAFTHMFRHPVTGEEAYISSFTVATPGSIADNARENFLAKARSQQHGGNVRLLDGKALLLLDRWATMGHVENVAETLSGLSWEIRYNSAILSFQEQALSTWQKDHSKPHLIDRLRIGAISHYAQKPLLPTIISTDIVMQLLTQIESANAILSSMNALTSVGSREKLSMSFVNVTAPLIQQHGNALSAQIAAAMNQLGPLAAT
jgi:hypothetical protein